MQEYRQWSDRQLMTHMDAAPRFQAAAMRKILAGRGYSDEILKLTRELEALPASQRLDAVERAATLPTGDARLVLRWFLADDDADVRLQALTTLATSGDPKMAEIARRCAVEDADPRVADFASKLLRQR
jgi:HEAT repeat protein